jgi:hypothetical protein
MMAIIQDPRTYVFAYKTLPTLHRRLVNKVSFMVRVQRDSNPRPATPQAAILSKLNYGPHPRVNLSIYEFPLILIFHFLFSEWPKSHTSFGDFEASDVPTWG